MTATLRASSRFAPGALAALLVACGGSPSPPATVSAPPISTAAATGTAATGAPSDAPSVTPPSTPLPLGDRLVATIAVSMAPCAMAVDTTTVWVTGAPAGLDRVDPATNAVLDRVSLDGSPCGVAIGPDGRVWVAELGVGAVVAVDTATRRVTDRIDGIGPKLWDLKAGFGSVWVVDRNATAVLRIDPETAKVSATIEVGPLPSGLAVMPAGVWVSDDSDGKVRRIDPATNEVAASMDVGGAPSWFADDGGSNLVIAQRGGGKVVVLDPATGAKGTPMAGWLDPLDGTVLGGQAWIPEGAGRRVGVLDLDAGTEPVRYALPGAVNPFVAEPGFGDVWVLDYGGSTIWRIRGG